MLHHFQNWPLGGVLEKFQFLLYVFYILFIIPLKELYSRTFYGRTMPDWSFIDEFLQRFIAFTNKTMSIQQLRWTMPQSAPTMEDARKSKDANMKLYSRTKVEGTDVIMIGDKPGKDVDFVMVYIHGGGFNLFHSGIYVPFFVDILKRVEALGKSMKIYSIDYDLAPEKKYPRQLQQIESVWRWITTEESVDSRKVVFAGDSAGGNLVVSASLWFMEQNLPLPGKIIPLSPWLNLKHESKSMYKGFWMDQLDKPTLDMVGTHYLLGDVDEKNLTPSQQKEWERLVVLPTVSPMMASKNLLAKLPSTMVFVGDHEVLQDDVIEFFNRLPVGKGHELIIGKNATHNFVMFGLDKNRPESLKFIDWLAS